MAHAHTDIMVVQKKGKENKKEVTGQYEARTRANSTRCCFF